MAKHLLDSAVLNVIIIIITRKENFYEILKCACCSPSMCNLLALTLAFLASASLALALLALTLLALALFSQGLDTNRKSLGQTVHEF